MQKHENIHDSRTASALTAFVLPWRQAGTVDAPLYGPAATLAEELMP